MLASCLFVQEESSPDRHEVEDEAVDALGIPGWDRVDELAKSLIELEGLAVSASQAQDIQRLYDRLVDYGKRPILFKPRPLRPSRGRRKSGHISVEAMKRLVAELDLLIRHIY